MQRRVAFFIPSLERGGVERTLVNLLKTFTTHAYNVDLLLVHAREEFLKQVPKAVHLVRLSSAFRVPGLNGLIPPRVRTAFIALPRLADYLRRAKPDVLISFQSSVVAVWAYRIVRSSTRLIVRESNTPSKAIAADRRVLARLVPLLKRWTYPAAAAIVANSQGAAEDLARVINVPRQQIHVIYNPTYDDSLLEEAEEPVEHPWFQAGEPPVVLGVGRLTYQKDFETLLRAFARVRKERVCRLVILGEGEERATLEALAEKLGVRRDVDLPGFVENPYKYMARASVFVLSSRYEGLPNVLIEALACGVPVVATDCPSGPTEILLDGSVGALVSVGDDKAMASEILHLLQNCEGARGFVLEGRKHLARFQPESCYHAYMNLISDE